jgi:transcriptional regulator with XRE-family HTH domain
MSGKPRSPTRLRELGLEFRALRRSKRWTQEALAARAGVSRDTIHRLEHGSVVDLSSLTALLAAMGQQLAFVETPRLDAAEMRRRFAHLHQEEEA